MTVVKIIKSAYVNFVYNTAPFFFSASRGISDDSWNTDIAGWVKVTTIITNLFSFAPQTPCHLGKGHIKQRSKAGTFSTFKPNFALFPLAGCLTRTLMCLLPLKLLSLFSLPSSDSLPYSLTQNRPLPSPCHHWLSFQLVFDCDLPWPLFFFTWTLERRLTGLKGSWFDWKDPVLGRSQLLSRLSLVFSHTIPTFSRFSLHFSVVFSRQPFSSWTVLIICRVQVKQSRDSWFTVQ